MFYKFVDSSKVVNELDMVSDGVMLKASSFFRSEYASWKCTYND